jgi:hypothetical protein
MHTRALPCGLQTSLIPACAQADGAVYLPFCVFRGLCALAEAAFWVRSPPLPLCLRRGAFTVEEAQVVPSSSCARGSAARRIHICEAAGATTSPRLRTSYACQRWWMETEGHAGGGGVTIRMQVDEDGEARGRGWECRWRRSAGTCARTSSPSSSRLTVWFGVAAGTVEAGTYPLPLPTHLFSPLLTLAPAQGECRCQRRRGVVWEAQASSCGSMHTHACTRRDGEARLRVRVRVRCESFPQRRPRNPVLPVRRWRSMHMCYAWDADVGAGVHTCAYGAHHALALVIERSRQDVRAYPPRCCCLVPTRIRKASAPRIWIYFWVWMRTGASVEVGMETSRGCAVHSACPLPCTHSYFSPLSLLLSFSPNSVGSLCSAQFNVCPTSHPPSIYARPSRSTVAKFGYDMSFFHLSTAHFVLNQ